MRLFVSDIKITRELTLYIYCHICISNIQKESQTLNIYIKTGTLRVFCLFNGQYQYKLTLGTLQSPHITIQIIELFIMGNDYEVARMLILKKAYKALSILSEFLLIIKSILCLVMITSTFCSLLTSLWV